jgi:endo-1,4-beta-xylanase
MSDGRPAIGAILLEADGSPLDAERMRTLTARDLVNDPLPRPIVSATGRARVELNPREPIQLCVRLKVPNFGEVYCYADNHADGYAKPAQIDFVTDAVHTRVLRVRASYESQRHAIGDQPEVDDLLAHAVATMRGVSTARHGDRRIEHEALGLALRAGETLALAAARTRISRFAVPRRDFKFGAMVSLGNAPDPQYEKCFRDAFNYATASWYIWKPEQFADSPEPVDYGRMDQSVDWCFKRGIEPKTFGYLYMTRGATPEWIQPIEPASAKGQAGGDASTRPINTLPNSEPSNEKREYNPRWGYERIKDLYRRVIRTTMARYNGKLLHAEIMNEAHDKANLWGMSHEQVLDMAKMAFDAAREGSPTIQRQMNHCCMWGEYGRRANADGTRRWSPFQFVKACFDHGVEYEAIGLQLYYPQQDVFEIDRMLDRFTAFNKPIQITEMATSAQDGLDPGSMRPRTYAPAWHGTKWSPTLQADWLEAMYTLCYSKPAFQSVGWWDFADKGGRFWPFGGLLDEQLRPKEGYHRLLKLQKEWGVAKSGSTVGA